MKGMRDRLMKYSQVTLMVVSGILVTPDKQKIAYNHYENGHKRVIIIAHGFYNSKDATLLQQLKDNLLDTYDVIMFDFRGHGKSSGLFTWTSKEALDLKEVLKYTKAKYSTVGLIGFSMGAATSINVLAEEDGIDSMIAISAPSDVGGIEYQFWKLDFKGDFLYTFGKEGRIGRGIRPGPFWLKKAKPIDHVGKIKCPILYIHGEKDWVVGHKHSQRLFEKTASKKQINIIKNGTHAEYLIRDNPKEMMELINNWFVTTLPGGK